MRRLFSAVVFGASLAVSSLAVGVVAPARAQEASADDAVSTRMFQVVEIMNQLNEASAILNDPRYQEFSASGDPDQMAAELEALAPDIRRAQSILSDGVSRLEALPPLNSSVENVEILTVMISDGIKSATSMNELLAQLLTIPKALRERDENALVEAGMAMVLGGVNLIENQALMLESRALMVPANGSEHSSVLITAQMYKGMGAAMRGAVGILDGDETATMLRAGAKTVTALTVKGRRDLAAEVNTIPMYMPAQRPGIRQLFAKQGEVFDLADQVVTTLEQTAAIAETEGLSEEARGEALFASIDQFTRIEAAQQALMAELLQINAELVAQGGN